MNLLSILPNKLISRITILIPIRTLIKTIILIIILIIIIRSKNLKGSTLIDKQKEKRRILIKIIISWTNVTWYYNVNRIKCEWKGLVNLERRNWERKEHKSIEKELKQNITWT